MKTEIGRSSVIKDPDQQTESGWSNWIENGVWFKAPTVDGKKFGCHDYDNGGYARGIRDCRCGCYMGSFASSGPVDPFGPCPKNPKR